LLWRGGNLWYNGTMKKTFLFLAAALLAVSPMFGSVASAKDLSSLKIKFSDNVNKDCNQPDGYDAVWGCYTPLRTGDVSTDTIVIRTQLPSALLPYVFFFNLGQYLMVNTSDQELSATFNPPPDLASDRSIRVIAGNAFVMWALGGHVSVPQQAFFTRLLTQ